MSKAKPTRARRRDGLSKQQAEAMAQIVDWWANSDEQIFRLFGYAGTGKTTLARKVADRLDAPKVVYAAYTGKAAHVMRKKGCDGARTLHSLIYLPAEKVRDDLESSRASLDSEPDPARRAELADEIRKLEQDLSTPNWILNDDSDLADADLLIIDEVSMVDEEMAEDILSFDVPVLVLGDPAQLPPPSSKVGYFTNAKPDYLLTEIHRQAADSVIIELATVVRTGGRPVRQRLGRTTLYIPLSAKKAKRFSQVIVGTHRERWRRTYQLREMHGLAGDLPTVGDKVICLQNNRDLDVFNGQMFKVLKASRLPRAGVLLTLEDEDAVVTEVPAWVDGFLGLEEEKRFKPTAHFKRERAFMTYGWAITCHKAQGSQWSSVLIVDESRWFRSDRAKWLYTAITRAEHRIAVVMPRGQ